MKKKVNKYPKVKLKDPKVLVCRLVTDYKIYCTKELIDSSKSLTYPNKKVLHFDNSEKEFLKDTLELCGLEVIKTPHFYSEREEVVVDGVKKLKLKKIPVREMMVRDMNMARDFVLKNNYDYMLILEQDIVPHPDIIERLLAHGKDVTSAFYWLDWTACTVNGRDSWATPVNYYEFKKEANGNIIPKIVFQPDPNKFFYPSGLKSYAHSGFGCTLISRKVLEKIMFKYNPKEIGQVDAHFYQDVIINGFIPYVDTGLIVFHDHQDWSKDLKT